jgi:uncharacterized protein (DUF2147 family)
MAAWLAAALLAAAMAPAAAAEPAPDAAAAQLLGNWLTEPRDGIIELSRAEDGTYQGRIIGGNAPTRVDAKNPDAALRGQKLLGQLILKGMKYEGNGQWSGGTIYDPDSGRTYRCHLQLLDADRLKVRGFIGVEMLGRTQIWTRYRGTSLTLPAPSQPPAG